MHLTESWEAKPKLPLLQVELLPLRNEVLYVTEEGMAVEGFGCELFEINCSVLLSKAAVLSLRFRDDSSEGKRKRIKDRQLSLASVAVTC